MRPILILVSFLMMIAGPANAAPEADLWPYWERHDPASEQTVDHEPWARFLERYLRVGDDGINRVAYGEVTDADAAALDRYIEELAALPIRSYARDEQMAYWINLYNALTVDVILEHHLRA